MLPGNSSPESPAFIFSGRVQTWTARREPTKTVLTTGGTKRMIAIDIWVILLEYWRLLIFDYGSDPQRIFFELQCRFGSLRFLKLHLLPRLFSGRLAFFLKIKLSALAISRSLAVACVRSLQKWQSMMEYVEAMIIEYIVILVISFIA